MLTYSRIGSAEERGRPLLAREVEGRGGGHKNLVTWEKKMAQGNYLVDL